MLRPLKKHEKKLLKKVDLYDWKREKNTQQLKVMRRYRIQKREDYIEYTRLVGKIHKLTAALTRLDPTDEFRMTTTEQLLAKLNGMGIINSQKSLAKAAKVSSSAFCRRRLPVVMVRLKMAPTIKRATSFIEQAHVRVGPHIITDPAFLVTRTMEDFVTWVDSSKIKEKIMRYNDQLDDFVLLGN
eukprot:TRINITY_DN1043_c0_g1_i1.p1 TRINITY_DN1043_c0_g1~~TRINITY_DN1043_c0_g1_i1.p1  ORF type:complete len:185 (-),score=47.97 TRINITY_DN1043_c0_g1_i1:43-597(-)